MITISMQFYGGRGSSSGRGGGAGSAKTSSAPKAMPNAQEELLTSSNESGIMDVKTFDDVPGGPYTFAGDGKETVDFFNKNSNYNELIDQMSDDERGAFEGYAEGDFMDGQIYVNGFAGLADGEKEMIRTYDKYLDQAYLDKGIEVRRLSDAQLVLGKGKKQATLEELQSLKGTNVISRGNLSTSAAKQGLAINGEKPIEYVMKIPGKTKGAGMWIGDKRVNGFGAKQREFMTNRDISFKVGNTKYNKARDVFEVELEYVGRLNHDYGGE